MAVNLSLFNKDRELDVGNLTCCACEESWEKLPKVIPNMKKWKTE